MVQSSMDIEELRARAMASMPNKKKQQQSRSQVASAPLPGKSVAANNLLDTNGMQKLVISCAPSATSLNTVHKERDVFLSSLHDLHSFARSYVADEKDDNLVIRFSDGESDSDAEDNCLKLDGRQKEGSFRGETIGSSANQSSPALLQTITTSASQQTQGICNQMVMMQKQLAAMRTTTSSAVQVRGVASGEGPSWQSSSKRKDVSGQKGLIVQKYSVKPAVPSTKPSGSDLEKLRKQIATKENELKLQRHMKLRKGHGTAPIPNGKVTGPGIAAVPLVVSTDRQLSVSPASSKLAGASEKEIKEEKQKVSRVTVQELPNASLKATENNQQQQRKRTFKTEIDDSRAMDGSRDKDLTWDLHLVGSKRPFTEDKPSGRKYLKVAADIDENNATDSQLFLVSVEDHCTRMENNICNSKFSKSMLTSTPSKCVISKGLHHTDVNDFPERGGNKKRKMDGSFTGSRNDINLEENHSSALYASQHQKHISVEGFQNAMYIDNAQATSKEDEKLEMEVEHKKQVLNQSIKSADIEECSLKNGSGLEQAIVNYLKDVKEGIDGRNVSSTEDGGFNFTYGRESIGPARENQSTRATSSDVPEGAQETRGSNFFPSMEVVKWQGGRDPLSTMRPTGNHVLDDLSQLGNISLQDLMKEEDVVDKELEEAQELRNRYEAEERVAWKAYRKAQIDVQAASQRCLDLHKKRERLSAQLRAVAMRDYSSKGYKDKDQLSKEEFYEPQRLLSHESHLEGSEQPGCKVNERGSMVDYAIMTSLKSHDGNNWSSSEYDFQSANPKSNNRLSMADVVPDTAKEVYVAYKSGDQGNIYGSVISEIVADQDRDILSCEPQMTFELSKHQKETEVKHGVSIESSAKITEDLERHQILSSSQHHLLSSQTSLRPLLFKTSENMEICSKSEHWLRRDDDISNMIKGMAEDNDENHKLIPKLLIIPETLSDKKKPAEVSYNNTNDSHGKVKCGFHEENIALLGDTFSSLEKTYVIPENGIRHIEYEGGQQHNISSVNPPQNPNFTYHDKTKSASSAERATSGSVGERSHGTEEDCFVSICNEDTENITLDKTGGSECEQANCKHNFLHRKRKCANQISAPEYGVDGLAKLSHTAAKKLNACVHSSSLIIETKEECAVSPGAETSTESLHGQNYEQDYNIRMTVAKHQQFADPFPQSLEKLLDVPGEVGNTNTVGDLIDCDVNENSIATCHSDNSLAGVMECEKINHKRCATTLAGLQSSKDNFEVNKRFHYSSSVDKDCTLNKENIWKICIGQTTSGSSNRSPDFEQLKQSDFTALANSNVSGGSVATGAANIENQDFMQQRLHSCVLKNDDVEKTLGLNLTQTTIQAANTNCCKDVGIQNHDYYIGMASSKLKVVFSYMKDIISTSHVILASSCRQMAPRILHEFAEYVPEFLLYESPLNMFKSYRIYSSLNSTNGVPDKPITCSHAINPFWPLCKFEHRGKCNNEDCPWQHARDYSLCPSQFLQHLKKYTEMDGSSADYEDLNSHGSDYSEACLVRAAKEAITRGIKTSFAVTGEQSLVSEGFFSRITGNYGLKVPVYRIGSHLIKADSLTVGDLIAQSTGRYWKLGFCQSFSIPFAVQRLLLPDMPCLSSGAVSEWVLGNNSRLPICLYSSSVNPDDSKKHLFRGHDDVECWLELAIDSMNFDSHIDKSDGRKKALCVLSRAIEANPNSVALWAVYLHMFYRKEKVVGRDDMFHHAVQHNKGSYELWLFFINSRLQMDRRLEAYKNAITALCQNASSDERQNKFSPYVLDLILQMLNFLSVSGCKLEGITWIDEFVFSSNGRLMEGQPNGINVSTVLPCLTVKDSCVLWVSCMYFRVYGMLPKAIAERLEFEQNLPFDVEWHRCHLSEAVYACTIKMMSKAVSSFSESCDQNSPESYLNEEDSLLAVHALVVNHVKCVLELEGLMSAQKLCSHYTKLYPFCIELVLMSSSIQSHCGDNRAGIAMFEESISNWPQGTPGVQRFWNQFIGYALKSEGVYFAKDLINKWFDQHTTGDNGVREYMDEGKQSRNFCGEVELDRRRWSVDKMFSLLNLAIYRFLNNNPKEAQSAIDQALKAALDDEDVKHCIKEYAALAFFGFPDELETIKNGFDSRMLQLLDKCFLGSQLFPVPKPLSRDFTKKIKKPKVRIFIENLLGPIPLDCSLLNLILETWYGPSLLPEKLDAFKDLVDFVEGVLELTPVNLKLVLSVSRVIFRRCNSQNISCTASFFWASSLLINSIFQSFPVAPENTWLEVGNFLESLGSHVILQEFYQQALSIHPFSVALWRSFLNLCRRTQNLTGVTEAAKQRGIIID